MTIKYSPSEEMFATYKEYEGKMHEVLKPIGKEEYAVSKSKTWADIMFYGIEATADQYDSGTPPDQNVQ